MEIDYITLIGNLGFPIAITSYLLVRFEKVIAKHTEAINSLVIKINK